MAMASRHPALFPLLVVIASAGTASASTGKNKTNKINLFSPTLHTFMLLKSLQVQDGCIKKKKVLLYISNLFFFSRRTEWYIRIQSIFQRFSGNRRLPLRIKGRCFSAARICSSLAACSISLLAQRPQKW
jgi:hypothetical protein